LYAEYTSQGMRESQARDVFTGTLSIQLSFPAQSISLMDRFLIY
jgi:hypothetical protein